MTFLPRKVVLRNLRSNGCYVTGSKEVLNIRWKTFQNILNQKIKLPLSFKREIGVKGLKILLKSRRLPLTGNKELLWEYLFSHENTVKYKDKKQSLTFYKPFKERIQQLKNKKEILANPRRAALATILEMYFPENIKITSLPNLFRADTRENEQYATRVGELLQDFKRVLQDIINMNKSIDQIYYDTKLTPRELAFRLERVYSTTNSLYSKKHLFILFDEFAKVFFKTDIKRKEDFIIYSSMYILGF